MCSILGIFRTQPVAIADLKMMAGRLHHRGPDDQGIFIEGNIGLGNTRLAIVDTQHGHQPMQNREGTLKIVYNGEVYNHKDIRRELSRLGAVFETQSDTETVLKAFEYWGAACLERLNGMFALAIWNTVTRTLFVARDRLGIKPLYVASLPDGFAFASEAKALLPLLDGGARPDWTALSRYLTLGYIPPLESPFAGISKFPAGSFAWVRSDGTAPTLNPQAYWRPRFGGGDALSLEHAADQLAELMENATRLELMSDVPVGVFLSGGLDSSAVALYGHRHRGLAASFALKFEEATHDESTDARLVADHLGLEHHELVFSPAMVREGLRRVAATIDEPFGDSTVVPLLMLSEFARQKVKVVLTGWGGDEVLAGYPTLKAHAAARLFRRLPGCLRHGLIPAIVNRLPVSDRYLSFEFKAKRFLRGMDLDPELQHFLWMGYFDDDAKSTLLTARVREQIRGGTFDPIANEVSGMAETELVDRIMHLDATFFLPGNGLFQADRMSMAASLEARVPLLNPDLLNFALPLPARIKMAGGSPKGLMKAALRPFLPDQIINKPKKGFGPPSSHWTRTHFADLLDRLFDPDRVAADGIFETSTIRRMLDEHRSSRADHGRTLWALMALQLWWDRFIADRASPWAGNP
jgi:asparagine synthase (glutamine-hydrolysing)